MAAGSTLIASKQAKCNSAYFPCQAANGTKTKGVFRPFLYGLDTPFCVQVQKYLMKGSRDMKTKGKFFGVLLAVCMVFCMAPTAVFAAENVPDSVWTDYAATDFAGGTGTEADPYQIATAEQLAKISKDVSKGNSYQGMFFKLTENIDLSSHRWIPIGISKWELSGATTSNWFEGFIDGNNKTISGLIVDERTDKNAAGFFGDIRNVKGGTVGAKNLNISDASIYADEDGLMELRAGILAGFVVANPGQQIIFENITVSGSVEIESTDGSNSVGGMIGYGDGIKATDCKAENISVAGASNSGGFIGNSSDSVFENCEASGTVFGMWALGGFIGYTTASDFSDTATQSVFKNCAADVEITGSDWRLGGFAGYVEYGKFENCVAYGNVTSTVDGWEPNVGGFIGQSDNADVNGCHAAGMVTSSSSDYKAGGFVGNYAGGTFTGCSFDSEKNSGLTAVGIGTISSGVEGCSTNEILANICEDYYGGHKYSTDWTVDTAATCTTDGSQSQHCERCDTTGNITVIPATGHTMQKTDKVEADCTTPGKEAYYTCETCGKYFEDETGKVEIANLDEYGIIPATGHVARTEWKSDGTGHWNECIYCGDKMNETSHSFEWVVDKEATETEKGSKHEKCTVCGYTKAAVEIPATGTSDSLQTGDNSNIPLWIGLMLATGTALTGTVLYNRKKKYSK